MKKIVIWLLTLALFVPVAEARKKKDPAGVIKDDVYEDAQYGFRLKISPDWKSKVGTEDENVRLVLVQKNYGIPSQYKKSPDYAVIPRITTYADTSGLTAQALLDSILSPSFKSKQKKEMTKEFEFLGQTGIIPKSKRTLTISGGTAVLWEGSVKYTKNVTSDTAADQGMRVSGGYGGGLIVIKKESRVVLFHVMGEIEFFDDVMKATTGMTASLEWINPSKQ